MRKFIIIILILLIMFTYVGNIYAESLNIPEGSYILIDSKSGAVLCQKNSTQKGLYPASTTKIMTGLLAIEYGDLNKEMIASEAAVNEIGADGANIGIMAGEKVKLKYLLQALLICSANETANIIAENISGTRQKFVDLMNKKAIELGALNTHFVNPCGAHNSDHYTTASDLAKIARYAMTLPEFRKIVAMESFQMPTTNKHDSWPVLYTTNKLMQRDSSEIYVINGIKTGFTVPAGFNLVSSAIDQSGMELIAVIMNLQEYNGQINIKTYSKELLDYGFNNFSNVTLVKSNDVYKSVKIGLTADKIPLSLIAKEDFNYVLPINKNDWNVKEVTHIQEIIKAPIKKGEKLGYIDFQRNGKSIGKVDIVASRDVSLAPILSAVEFTKNLIDNYIIVKIIYIIICIVIFFVLLRATLRRISRRINAKRRAKRKSMSNGKIR